MNKLTTEDIKELALEFNLEPALIKAVQLTESRGSGFYDSSRDFVNGKSLKWTNELLVRLEGHWFRKFTKGIYDISYPTLSYSDWKLGYKYAKVGQLEFGRFMEAFLLNKEAAWLSSSWGMFQIMGFNYNKCGYNSVKEMLIDFYKGEKYHLKAFLNFCENLDILDDLREKRFSDFARIYNGKNYKVNKYDTKLEKNYINWRNKI